MQRGCAEVQDLLERPVGVTQPARVSRVNSGGFGAGAEGVENPVAPEAGFLRGGCVCESGHFGERVQVGELAGGGVKALPQACQRLHAVERPRLDPDRGELCLNLLGLSQAVGGRSLVRAPRGASSARGQRLAKADPEIFSLRFVRDGQPPAGGDRRLL